MIWEAKLRSWEGSDLPWSPRESARDVCEGRLPYHFSSHWAKANSGGLCMGFGIIAEEELFWYPSPSEPTLTLGSSSFAFVSQRKPLSDSTSSPSPSSSSGGPALQLM